MSISEQMHDLLEAISWSKKAKTIPIKTPTGGEYRAIEGVENVKALTAAFEVMGRLDKLQYALKDFMYDIDVHLKSDKLWGKFKALEKKETGLEYQTRKWRSSVNWWAKRGDPFANKIKKDFLETSALLDKILKMGLPFFQSIKGQGGEAQEDIGTSYEALVTEVKFYQAAIKKAVGLL